MFDLVAVCLWASHTTSLPGVRGVSQPTAADTKVLQEIVTDRPDFTESSSTVGSGRWQVEMGLTYSWTNEDRETQAPETLLRVGCGPRWELRLGLPSYRMQREGGVTGDGWGDMYFGAKVQLLDGPRGLQVACIPGLLSAMDTQSGGGSRHAADVKFAWSKDVGAGRSLAGMLAVGAQIGPGAPRPVWQHTLALSLPLTARASTILEHSCEISHGNRPDHVVHLGFTFRPTRSTQLDLHVGTSLSGPSRGAFVGFGYSFLR
jgi:hypothetical protein